MVGIFFLKLHFTNLKMTEAGRNTHFSHTLNLKRKPGSTLNPCAYVAQKCVEMTRSQSLSLHRDTKKKKKTRKKKKSLRSFEAEELTFASGFPHRKESVWNLIHKHYSPGSPAFPSPAGKRAFLLSHFGGTFSTIQSSISKFNERADWDLVPAMFHQTHLSSAIADLSVKQPRVKSTLPRFPLLSVAMWPLNEDIDTWDKYDLQCINGST